MKNENRLPLGCGITLLVAVFGPMFLLSAEGIIWGWTQIRNQHRLMSTAKEVDALVTSSKMAWQKNAGNQTSDYRPTVHFTYSVDAKKRESSTISPARKSGRHAWAKEMVDRFPAGENVTAYYDPADPSVAFLLRDYVPDPYVITGFSCLFTGFAVVFPASFFWPWPTIRVGMTNAGLMIYEIPIILAVEHYFDHAVPRAPHTVTWSVVAIGLGIVPLLLAIRWWILDPNRIAAKLRAIE